MGANPVSGEEACQRRGVPRPSRSISDGTRWEQTVGFSRKQCSLQETGVSLQTLDHGESIGSRFCFFYETSTFKGRHKASHSIWMWVWQLWNCVLPLDHTWPWYSWFFTLKSALDLTSVMISGCLDSLKPGEGPCWPAAPNISYLWLKKDSTRRIHITSKFVRSIRRLRAREKQANNDSETDPKISGQNLKGVSVVAPLISARPKSAI